MNIGIDLICPQLPDNWMTRLAATIGAAVREFAPQIRGVAVAMLAVDCHPWHGSISLAILTAEEAAKDGFLNNADEMAAWQNYRFTDGLGSWQPAFTLGREMQAVYEATADRQAAVDAFLKASAHAAASPETVAAIETLTLVSDFRVSVTHPDDGREFYPPAPDGEILGP